MTSIERAAIQISGEQLEQLERVHFGYIGDDEVYDHYTDEKRMAPSGIWGAQTGVPQE